MARKTIAQLEALLSQKDADLAALDSRLEKACEMCDQMNDKIVSLEGELQEALGTILFLEVISRADKASLSSLMKSVSKLTSGEMTFKLTREIESATA
jgi:hypothetical protein